MESSAVIQLFNLRILRREHVLNFELFRAAYLQGVLRESSVARNSYLTQTCLSTFELSEMRKPQWRVVNFINGDAGEGRV